MLKKLHLNYKCRLNRPDKYDAANAVIKTIFYQGSEGTYDYRCMHGALLDQDFGYAPNTLPQADAAAGTKNQNLLQTHGTLQFLCGAACVIKENILKQQFNETRPYHVLHTDITEYKLTS